MKHGKEAEAPYLSPGLVSSLGFPVEIGSVNRQRHKGLEMVE